MRLLATLILLGSSILPIHPQKAAQHYRPKAVLPDWSPLLPAIPNCEIGESPVYDNKQGRITQYVRYRPTSDVIGIVLAVGEQDAHNCPSFTLDVTYPFTPPPPPPVPPLTKEQLREQKKIAERMRKNDKKFRKLYELMIRPPGPPPARSFVFKSFPSLQYFGGSCDYTPCESYWVTKVSVQFSSDKTLMITVRGNFERAEEILNAVNFAGLDMAMRKWMESKDLESKHNGFSIHREATKVL